jgi:MFS family permease
LTIRQPPGFETRSKEPQSKAILKDSKFLFLCAGTAVFDLGLFTPLFFISLYAESLGQTASFAFYLTAILSGANFFGRIAAGQLGDMFGFYNM